MSVLRVLGLLTSMALQAPGAGGFDTGGDAPAPVRLMTLEPGHFHAALIQKEMYAGVSDEVHVYAPLGPDLIAHLGRIAQFNLRPERPTSWRLEVHAGPDPLERMLRERPGNVVVLSGRNRGKIDRILASVRAGLHVLADKPWVIETEDVPKLEAALAEAERRGLVAYDVMTERYEITSILQRELLRDAAVAGEVLPGSEAEPGLRMESVHHVMKTVAGRPNLRPAWFFDTGQQGEAIADVGTHLVDLVPWMLFPEQPIDHVRDVHVLSGRRWPTVLSQAEFERVTGEAEFPAFLAQQVKDGRLHYFANAEVAYVLRGIHVRLAALWSWEAPAGAGDTHLAVVRGSRSRLEVRQGPEQGHRTELYVVPAAGQEEGVRAALQARVAALGSRFPGLGLEDRGAELRLVVPDAYRTGHEAHFAEVTSRFLEYVKDPGSLPRWENSNMLAKYLVTTRGTALSRERSDP